MIEKHGKLITVLVFAVMIIILAYLVASVTSCTPLPDATAQAVPTVRVLPTVREDGTVYHPYTVDPSPFATPVDTWNVLMPTGHEQWHLNWLYDVQGGPDFAIKPGQYIWYRNAKYRVLVINRSALTMSVSGQLDCCAADEG